MGKYDFYIWAAFGITFVLMFLGAITAFLSHSSVLKELKSQKGTNADVN